MELLIFLLICFIGSIVLFKKTYDEGWELISIITAVCSGIYLIIHLFFWGLASYDYNIFVVKRDAFQETLNVARKSGNQIELAAIIKNVSDWNQSLAAAKYNNKIFLLKDYTDDRVESLSPIR